MHGFKNASCEFDVEHLKPTYKLLIGIPGKSNAFEISQKLGLDINILNRAKDFISEDNYNIEELLKNIYNDKIIIEKEKEEINKNLIQITNLRKSLERDNSNLEIEEKNIISKAKNDARKILLDAKDTASSIIKEMSDKSDNLKDLNNLRNSLNSSIKNLSSFEKNKNSDSSTSAIELKSGMNVLVISLNQEGTVVSLPNKSNHVQVQIGSLKMNVAVSDLRIINKSKNNSSHKITSSTLTKSKNVSSEINVIGCNVEEAIFIIDKYLDDVAMSSLKTARIVHGKGTGKLREGIHTFLKKHPHVKSYRIGTFGEGEMGVSIVEIKH